MATTVTVSASKVLTVVTDQAYASVHYVVGPDSGDIAVEKNVVTITGMTATLLTNDKAVPKTTLTYQLS